MPPLSLLPLPDPTFLGLPRSWSGLPSDLLLWVRLYFCSRL